ncbi:MAG: hypothetical protein ACR2QW_08305, partial [bacterium]
MKPLLESNDEAAALELLHSSGCTDGLPVVIPTRERVDVLIDRVDLDPDLVLGVMGPKQGVATVQLVAVSAVMAGCLPEYFPIVISAVRAVCRKEFDLTEVNQTTHCLAPLIVGNGNARIECGSLNSGAGILGPGNRANASIGRALSLACINIAGRKSGTTDMAIFSSPGKFSSCIAEAEEQSCFEPYHVSKGYSHEDSVVTVIGVEAPHSIICELSKDRNQDSDRLISCIASVIANAGSNHIYCGGKGAPVVTLCPEHARLLGESGYDRKRIQIEVTERAVMPRSIAKQLYGDLMYDNPGDGEWLRAVRDPDQIMLIVAGGMGTYSM